MKVLLFDLDISPHRRPFPNLALMKLSAYHKRNGDEIFLLNFPLCQPDKTYVSCVFTWNNDNQYRLPQGAMKGGSGLDLKVELPLVVEHMMPDYSLYPGANFSVGFTSRGCIRSCPWCIVPQKEGNIMAAGKIYDFWDRKHRLIILLDNNLLAAPNWRQTLEDLASEDVYVDFNQGLDIRLVNEEVVTYLRRLKFKRLRFSFDALELESQVRAGVKLLTDAGINSRRLSFYVLFGFGKDRTAVKRMKILDNLNVDIYPMAYRGPNGFEPARVLEAIPGKFFHGPRHNIKKMLRLKGRLPA
jgi:hypothetical protein